MTKRLLATTCLARTAGRSIWLESPSPPGEALYQRSGVNARSCVSWERADKHIEISGYSHDGNN